MSNESGNNKHKLLLVDKNKEAIDSLCNILSSEHFEVDIINNSDDGFKKLLENTNGGSYASVIMGQSMLGNGAISLLRKIKSCSIIKSLPVIIESGKEHKEEELEQYVKAGAWYYFSYPIEKTVANTIILTAIRDHDRYINAEKLICDPGNLYNNLKEAKFKFQSLEEIQPIANFLSEACPNPKLTVVGISEILINAVEHGNLNISYKEKSELHAKDMWLDEIKRRKALPENINKFVTIIFKREPNCIKIRIIDQGKGFDWKKFQSIDNSRILDNHGRGIVMAKSLAFKSVEYFGNGNEVECTISLDTPEK